MSHEDIDYYRERALVERTHAADASNPTVAFVHSQMADLYEALTGQAPIDAALPDPWEPSRTPSRA